MDERKSGAYLKEKRIAAGLNKEDVAEKVGVSAYDVSCWETGFFPEAQYLLPLSETLGVTVEEILKGEDATFSASAAETETIRQQTRGEKSVEAQAPQPASDSSAPPAAAPVKASPSTAISSPEVAPAFSNVSPSHDAPVSASASAPRKEEKSYYETLREQMKYTDEDGKPYKARLNGFSAGDRKFGYIVCSLYLAVLLLICGIMGIKYITRERVLTQDNYNKYIDISVVSVSNFNPDEYNVTVTAKKKITDLNMEVEVSFRPLSAFQYEQKIRRTVHFYQSVLKEGDRLSETIKLEKIVFNQQYTVLSVSGGIS